MKKFVIFIAFLFALHAAAEPSKTVEYLMSEPVTLFDQGLLSLGGISLLATEFPELIQEFNTWAKYDWESNRITVHGTAYQDNLTTKASAPDALCKRIIERVKFNLGYGEMSPEFRKMGMAGLAAKFRHLGFQSKREPDSLENDLASITRLEVSVYTSKNNQAPFANVTTCISDLTASDIYTKAADDK